MSEVDCTFELNADITGFGVRLATYIQSLLFWCLITTQMYDQHHTVVKTAADFTFVGMVYLIAAFVQAKTNQMNIIDGYIVYLVTILPIYSAPAVPMGSLYLGVGRVLGAELGFESQNLPVVFERSRKYWLLRIRLFATTLSAYILWVVWMFKLTSNEFTTVQKVGCAWNPDAMIWSFGTKQITIKSFTYVVQRLGIALTVVVGVGLLTDVVLIMVGCVKCGLFSGGSRRHYSTWSISAESEDSQYAPPTVEPGLEKVKDAVRMGQGCGTYFSMMIGVGLLVTLFVVIESILHMSSIRQAETVWTYGQVVALAVALMQVLQAIASIIEHKVKAKKTE